MCAAIADIWALAESIMTLRNSSQHSAEALDNHVSAPAFAFCQQTKPREDLPELKYSFWLWELKCIIGHLINSSMV